VTRVRRVCNGSVYDEVCVRGVCNEVCDWSVMSM